MLIETLNKLQAAVINWTSPNAGKLPYADCPNFWTTTRSVF
jgi:hypothetical protein